MHDEGWNSRSNNGSDGAPMALEEMPWVSLSPGANRLTEASG